MRHAPWLQVRLRRRCVDDDVVAEALQETFVAAWRGAGRWRGDGDVGAWLWGIAIRRLIDLLAKRPRHRPLADRSRMNAYRRVTFADAPRHRAWLSKPLPTPPAGGWRLRVPTADTGRQRPGWAQIRIHLPAGDHRDDTQAVFRAVLDETGTLTIHRGGPDYLFTDDLTEALHHTGMVYRAAMPSTPTTALQPHR